MNSLLSDLYTLEGRIGRLYYLWRFILLCVLAFGFFFTAIMGEPILRRSLSNDLIFHSIMISYFLFMAVMSLLPHFTLMTRRLHDFNFSGWVIFILFILSIAIPVPLIMHLGIEGGVNTALILNGCIWGMFVFALLFWPGSEGANKYGHGNDLYHTSMKPSKKEQFMKKASSRKSFYAILAAPIPEDSLYIFKHLKTEYKDIQKINIPEDRQKIEFIVVGYSDLNESKLRKILSGFGISVCAVRKSRQ